MSVVLPFGPFDRADGNPYVTNGVPGSLGTLTPASARKVKPISTYLEEAPDSPQVELGNQATVVHTFNCDPVTAQSIVATPSPYYRGNIFTDSAGNSYKILSVTVSRQRGDTCQVQIITEATSFGLPPDEFHVDVLEFNPALQKHPRYSGINKSLIQLLTQDALYGSTLAAKAAAVSQINFYYGQTQGTTPNETLWLASWELLTKLLRGEETFYLAGFRVEWSQYFALPPELDPGGRLEDPVTGGLPVQFYSSTGAPGGNNIFTALASARSPQFYTGGISWLRQADTVEFQRTWFRLTHSWLGGPSGGLVGNGYYFLGQWDFDIYNPEQAGTNYGEFESLVDPDWPGQLWADT